MRRKTRYAMFIVPFLLLLVWIVPAGAEVYIQCPCLSLDANGKPDPTQLLPAGVYNPAGTGINITVNAPGAQYNSSTGNIECTYTDNNPQYSIPPTCPATLSTCPPGCPAGPPCPPVNHSVACKALSAGDGHTTMADGFDLFGFGFDDVTGVATGNIMNMANNPPCALPTDPTCPGGMRGAEGPAPTLNMKEGQEFYLSLTNVGMFERPDLIDPHTVHYHGQPDAASVFDGEPMASIAITMGHTLTYYYNNHEPGTYMFHCHVEAAEHMQMGMLGNLFVRPAQDGTPITYQGRPYTTFAYNDCPAPADPMCGSTGYDKAYPILEEGFDPIFHDADHTYNKLDFQNMHDTYMVFNGRGYPDTVNPCPGPGCTTPIVNSLGINSQNVSSLITATAGQRILLRIASLVTTDFFTVRVLGIPMRVVGMGARLLRGPGGKNLSYTTNSITIGGGEAMDVILDTTGVAPGTYFMYTTNLNNLSNNDEDFGGMMTEIVIN